MISKDKIAKDDLTRNLQQYPGRPFNFYKAAVTGSQNEGSIGKKIIQCLRERSRCDLAYAENTDVTSLTYVESFKQYQPDALIMCHGLMHLDWIGELEDNDVSNVINVNLTGTIWLVNRFVQASIDTPFRKKIISIGSMAYKKVLNGSSPYCAAKAGLAQFIRCAAWELAPKGYDVYCIHPSNVDFTPMAGETISQLQRFRDLSPDEATAYWGSNYVRGRSLTPKEIADLVVHLIEVDDGFLSGQQFEMTGGQR